MTERDGGRCMMSSSGLCLGGHECAFPCTHTHMHVHTNACMQTYLSTRTRNKQTKTSFSPCSSHAPIEAFTVVLFYSSQHSLRYHGTLWLRQPGSCQLGISPPSQLVVECVCMPKLWASLSITHSWLIWKSYNCSQTMGTKGREVVRGAPNLGASLSRLLTAHPRIRFVKASEHRIRTGILWLVASWAW